MLPLEPIPPSAMVFSEVGTDFSPDFRSAPLTLPRGKRQRPRHHVDSGSQGDEGGNDWNCGCFQEAGAMGAPRFASILRKPWKYTAALQTEKAVER